MAGLYDRPRKPVLVLGASGFIGSRIVALLESSPEYQPIAVARRRRVGIQSVDATDMDALRPAIRDAAYVVNCVAGSNRTMIAATRTLCDAARRDPPRRIVHLSSMAVYGAATGNVPEGHPAIAPISGEGVAKIACEQLIQKYVVDGGDAVILRPTCVFGPGGNQWTKRIGNLLRSGRLGDLGPAGDGCCNLTFIDDLVASIVQALDAPGVSSRAFNISSSSALTWNDFLFRFAHALGATPVRRIPRRMLKMETTLLAPVRHVVSLGLGRVGLQAGQAITPSLLALMRQDIRIDCSSAIETLALHRTSADRIIAIASRWLRTEQKTAADADTWMEPARS